MKSKLLILCLVLLGGLFYLLTLRGNFGNANDLDVISKQTSLTKPFESSHERASFALTQSFLQDHSLSLSKPWADFGSPDISYGNGKFFSFFPPGVSFVIMPLYLWGQQFNLAQLMGFATISLFAIGTLIFVFLICKNIFKLSLSQSFLGSLIFGFATTSWSYAITIYQHLPAAFFVVFCFYFAWKYKNSLGFAAYLYGALVWIGYGLSIFFDYPNALILLPIMFYFLFVSFNFLQSEKGLQIRFNSAILFTFVFFIVLAGLHLYYNQTAFGSWHKIGQSFARYDIANFEQLTHPAADTQAASKSTSEVFHEDNIINGGFTLLFGPDKGIFVFSPILFLGLFGIFVIRNRISEELGLLIALIIFNFAMYASFGDPWGGWAYGPRYLIPSMAPLAILVVLWLADNPSIFRRLITFILFVYSAAVALLGAVTTNVVPPKIEAVPLHLPYYNFLLNYHLLLNNTTSNFIYQTYLSHQLTLKEYFLVIFTLLMLLVLVTLILIPRKRHAD